MKSPSPHRPFRGIPLRALAPNAVTALALCFGLTGVRFGISGEWEKAIAAIVIAGVLDGLDGRIARMLKGESRFGAELDSLSDVIAFGVSPAILIYLWSLQHLPQFGWVFALAHAVCCALRLARFNASIDVKEQPHKSAGYLTGVPAPAGAGLALLPIYLWLVTGEPFFRQVYVVAPWAILVAFLMISDLATFSWSSFRLRPGFRLWVLVLVGLVGAALISAPWATLSVIAILYILAIPFSVRSYARVRRQRAAQQGAQ
ncbi:CDP-diacylglycerol O-phosphatidyltransferase [Sphingomonas oleivorans]|uniref:CDP-diacylglycerol O-phosphatidyltransferase n=1 Tax=Sphingomonas oleivorans TaxID=1735121 RepID=A0A2T5FYJ9_9SPHN|nr:phosphatidylcholine/phosphatidylserine synthase [Sphingomonas oleivorans]PTQ11607.1 CDP-diacylglycerol O-phosphatidyltransferase [Sphingomonas oleivorans]